MHWVKPCKWFQSSQLTLYCVISISGNENSSYNMKTFSRKPPEKKLRKKLFLVRKSGNNNSNEVQVPKIIWILLSTLEKCDSLNNWRSDWKACALNYLYLNIIVAFFLCNVRTHLQRNMKSEILRLDRKIAECKMQSKSVHILNILTLKSVEKV